MLRRRRMEFTGVRTFNTLNIPNSIILFRISRRRTCCRRTITARPVICCHRPSNMHHLDRITTRNRGCRLTDWAKGRHHRLPRSPPTSGDRCTTSTGLVK